MITIPIIKNNNYQGQINFKGGYTPKQICSELCKGACCNHGTNMNANLKKIADKICSQYKTVSEDLKSTILIKAPIVKWIVYSDNPEVQTLTKLANTYIDAISRESDSKKIAQLNEELEKLNQKLIDVTKNQEYFLAVTNKKMVNASPEELAYSRENICMFKDHNKTNLCTIYQGVKNDAGEIVERPSPCLLVGGAEMPCPWLNPEKYGELFRKVKAKYEQFGYFNISDDTIKRYIAEQFNLNEIFAEKIWKPFLKSLGINS